MDPALLIALWATDPQGVAALRPPAPTTTRSPEAHPLPPRPADPEERRELRQAAAPTALPPGRVDLALALSAESQLPGALSLGLAFVGWSGVGGTADLALAQDRAVSLTLGLEGRAARGLALEALAVPRLEDTAPGDWSITTRSAGGALRLGLHIDPQALPAGQRTRLSPYVLGLLGVERTQLELNFAGQVEGQAITGQGALQLQGARVGGAMGLHLVGPRRTLVNLELRYLTAHTRESDWVLTTNSTAASAALFPILYSEEAQAAMNVPQGFAWVIAVGHRF